MYTLLRATGYGWGSRFLYRFLGVFLILGTGLAEEPGRACNWSPSRGLRKRNGRGAPRDDLGVDNTYFTYLLVMAAGMDLTTYPVSLSLEASALSTSIEGASE